MDVAAAVDALKRVRNASDSALATGLGAALTALAAQHHCAQPPPPMGVLQAPLATLARRARREPVADTHRRTRLSAESYATAPSSPARQEEVPEAPRTRAARRKAAPARATRARRARAAKAEVKEVEDVDEVVEDVAEVKPRTRGGRSRAKPEPRVVQSSKVKKGSKKAVPVSDSGDDGDVFVDAPEVAEASPPRRRTRARAAKVAPQTRATRVTRATRSRTAKSKTVVVVSDGGRDSDCVEAVENEEESEEETPVVKRHRQKKAVEEKVEEGSLAVERDVSVPRAAEKESAEKSAPVDVEAEADQPASDAESGDQEMELTFATDVGKDGEGDVALSAGDTEDDADRIEAGDEVVADAEMEAADDAAGSDAGDVVDAEMEAADDAAGDDPGDVAMVGDELVLGVVQTDELVDNEDKSSRGDGAACDNNSNEGGEIVNQVGPDVSLCPLAVDNLPGATGSRAVSPFPSHDVPAKLAIEAAELDADHSGSKKRARLSRNDEDLADAREKGVAANEDDDLPELKKGRTSFPTENNVGSGIAQKIEDAIIPEEAPVVKRKKSDDVFMPPPPRKLTSKPACGAEGSGGSSGLMLPPPRPAPRSLLQQASSSSDSFVRSGASDPISFKKSADVARSSILASASTSNRFQVDGSGKVTSAGLGALNSICATPVAKGNGVEGLEQQKIGASGMRSGRLYSARGDIYNNSSRKGAANSRARPLRPGASGLLSKTPGMTAPLQKNLFGPIVPRSILKASRQVSACDAKDSLPGSCTPASSAPVVSGLIGPEKENGLVKDVLVSMSEEKIDFPRPNSTAPVDRAKDDEKRREAALSHAVANNTSTVLAPKIEKEKDALTRGLTADEILLTCLGDGGRASASHNSQKRYEVDLLKTAPVLIGKRPRLVFADDAAPAEDKGKGAPVSSSGMRLATTLKRYRRPRLHKPTTKSALQTKIEARVYDRTNDVDDGVSLKRTSTSVATPRPRSSGSGSGSSVFDNSQINFSAPALPSSEPSAAGSAGIAQASASNVPSTLAPNYCGSAVPVAGNDDSQTPMSNLVTSFGSAITSFIPSFNRKLPSMEQSAEEKAAAAIMVAEADAKRREAEMANRREVMRLAKQKEAEDKAKRLENQKQHNARVERHRIEANRVREADRKRKQAEAEEQRRRQKEEEDRKKEEKRRRVQEQQKKNAAQEAERRRVLEQKERSQRERLMREKARPKGAGSSLAMLKPGATFAAPVRSVAGSSAKRVPPTESYDMSAKKDKTGEESSDSETERMRRLKKIPHWAQSSNLPQTLVHETRDPDSIFEKVQTINLEDVFKGHPKKRRFRSRTSSGLWAKDHLTSAEEMSYKKATTGFDAAIPPPTNSRAGPSGSSSGAASNASGKK